MSVFLDFDGTITAEDTVMHLANFALRFQRERRLQQEAWVTPTATTSVLESTQLQDNGLSEDSTQEKERGGEEDLSSRWDGVVHAYLSDHKSHVSSYAPRASDRQCAEDEMDFLRSLKNVETRSLARINECALFRGIDRDAFREAGRELVHDGTIQLRPGFQELVRAALRRGLKVNVVSVNWSAAFIEGACGFAGDEIRVFANEVRKADGAVLGPRVLVEDGTPLDQGSERSGRNLTNSCDKHDVVRAVRREQGIQDKPSFYFGDSTTDMECLLGATRGFVVADDDEKSALIETLRRIGNRVPHLRDADAADELVWVSNFEEVLPWSHLASA
jgi:phosphoserine phosphatase